MRIEALIRRLWSEDETLSRRIPPQRVTLGRPSTVRLPCAVLRPGPCVTQVLTNTPEHFLQMEVDVECWDDDYDAARETVEHLRRVLDRVAWVDDQTATRRALRVVKATASRHAEGHWAAVVRLVASVAPAAC